MVGPVSLHNYLWLTISAIAIVSSIPWFLPGPGKTRDRLASSFAFLCAGTFVTILPFKESFAVIHVLYGAITCAVPAVGVSIGIFAIRHRNERARWISVLAVAALMPAPVGFYTTNIEPNRLEVNTKTVALSGVPKGQTIKVAVLADIQSPSVGSHQRKAVDAVTKQNPDLILYAGDLYSGEDNPLPKYRSDFVSLVNGLKATDGVFFVGGDHDYVPDLRPIVQEGGAVLLVNEVSVAQVGSTRVGILGLDNADSPAMRSAITDFAARSDVDVKLVLAHHPDVIRLVPSSVDLVASGHTHGGQVQLPFIGPLITLSEIPRKQAGGGLFTYPNGTQLFVTRGVGLEYGAAPKIRFGAVPEVNVLDLVAAS